jgi:hypothetical protein
VGQANAVSRRIATEPAGANLVGHWIERRAGRVHGRSDTEAAQTKQALGVARGAWAVPANWNRTKPTG